MILRSLAAAVTTVFVIGSAAAAASPPAADSRLREILGLLHGGRFDEADERAGALLATTPDEPASAFVHAFVTWWRLLYDSESTRLTQTFDQRIEHAAAVGKAALVRRDRVDDRIWAGYSRLLLAQLRASQRKTLAAAREAREAHRLLTEAARAEPSSSAALFGLGTYNYYADRVSALVKGLRFLLGLPAGDHDKGLEQLERAATTGTFFGLESRLLRATIFSGRHDRDYVRALAEAGRALALAPEGVTSLDAVARLDLILGREDLAAARLDLALSLADAAPRADRSVRAALALARARVEFARLRPDLALERLQSLREGARSLPSRIDRDAKELAAVSKWLVGSSPSDPKAPAGASPPPGQEVWKRLARAADLEASQGIAASLSELRAASRDYPDDPNVALFLGRSLLRSGNASEALDLLATADRSGRLPEPWIGPCRLLAGESADRSGDRARAIELYRKASKSPAFLQSPAATLLTQVPYPVPR